MLTPTQIVCVLGGCAQECRGRGERADNLSRRPTPSRSSANRAVARFLVFTHCRGRPGANCAAVWAAAAA
jgi:hypothetical protein